MNVVLRNTGKKQRWALQFIASLRNQERDVNQTSVRIRFSRRALSAATVTDSHKLIGA